ncbi:MULTISPECIES: CHASE2 domain-containing serine/threonine-protein kinase [unclassified Nostoc]|uniref:CHASE2 domain-containing serine/threonine-protein kinase n=1 Tax=unclassified Nostoc TaxID=2593658 RepID=UPI002AD2F17A|nr:CHASE2 domain-containing serine/threonine-protein kinase [Nostoc sp. DedQUE03]MDZ7973561.1 CHASE2 domain-containing serine/threonine-protein kinase [Nostoc sp. DedQUE03]MDZ8049412.1 CHASE2 domain-containing serine/threonine-protein kinase [Nostoc sp. DedQUE02]
MISGLLEKLRVPFVKVQDSHETSKSKSWLQIIFVTSVGVTAFIWGVRELTWLQPWELRVYDQMLRSRPPEAPDRRILLVKITDEDLKREKWTLSPRTINRLLKKIESYQPRIIGLYLFQPEDNNLVANFPNQDNIISTCLFSSLGRDEIPPPSNVPIDNVGFSDVVADKENDQVLRRSLLFAKSIDKKCTTSFAFGAQIAINYLEKQGIEYDFTKKGDFLLGKTLFLRLRANSGGYQHLDADGYQILLNYRHPNSLANQVTLKDVLSGRVNPSLFKDRLVIIGTTAANLPPGGFYTPYSALPDQPPRMPALFIHAQIASQLISTVLDGRSLIWYWPNWAELIWIWGWSLLGSVLAWRWQNPLFLLVAVTIALLGLVLICVALFLQAGWVPLIPSALALVISSICVIAYTSYQNQQQTQVIILQVEKQQEAIAQLNVLLEDKTAIPDSSVDFFPPIDSRETKSGDLLLGGRYKISQTLGAGGFGRTYLAQDTQRPGNPTCVVKKLMPARQDTRFLQVARRLFNSEAEILESLGKHHQIPELLAYFEDDQEFYLIQQYIEGHTLSEELPPVQNVQNESFVIEMLKEVLEVLEFVHQHRVIHRDIKPTNIIRSAQDNRLVLIDFGAVKLMQPPSSEQTELETVAIGTRGYAPPEQFAGHPRLCSDIYALGIIAIQAITGIPPQELHPDIETGNIMWRQTVQVSEELAAILDKMVCYHFSDRYQSATAVLQDLKRFSTN